MGLDERSGRRPMFGNKGRAISYGATMWGRWQCRGWVRIGIGDVAEKSRVEFAREDQAEGSGRGWGYG